MDTTACFLQRLSLGSTFIVFERRIVLHVTICCCVYAYMDAAVFYPRRSAFTELLSGTRDTKALPLVFSSFDSFDARPSPLDCSTVGQPLVKLLGQLASASIRSDSYSSRSIIPDDSASHCAFVDSRHGASRRHSNQESKASSIHDMATGHRSGLRTASGRVK